MFVLSDDRTSGRTDDVALRGNETASSKQLMAMRQAQVCVKHRHLGLRNEEMTRHAPILRQNILPAHGGRGIDRKLVYPRHVMQTLLSDDPICVRRCDQ